MKNRHKIILVKSIIASAGILMIVSLFLGITSGMELYGDSNEFFVNLSYISLLIFTINAIIMLILMCKIDIRPEKTKPMRLKLKDNDYEMIKENLCQKYEHNGYQKLTKYEYSNAKIDYMIKQNHSVISLVIYIRIEEMTEELMYGFEEHVFAEQILNLEDIELKDKLDITYVITVDKVTPAFSKYIERNVKQTFWTTVLPVGISLASKTLYISTQEEGFSIFRYKKMKKQFIMDIDELLER